MIQKIVGWSRGGIPVGLECAGGRDCYLVDCGHLMQSGVRSVVQGGWVGWLVKFLGSSANLLVLSLQERLLTLRHQC